MQIEINVCERNLLMKNKIRSIGSFAMFVAIVSGVDLRGRGTWFISRQSPSSMQAFGITHFHNMRLHFLRIKKGISTTNPRTNATGATVTTGSINPRTNATGATVTTGSINPRTKVTGGRDKFIIFKKYWNSRKTVSKNGNRFLLQRC